MNPPDEAQELIESKACPPRRFPWGRAGFTVLCALGCAGWFLLTFLRARFFPWYSYAISGALLTLFIALGARFVPVWFDAWKPETAAVKAQVRRPKHRDELYICLCVLALHLTLMLIAFARLALRDWWPGSIGEALKYLKASDSAHYADIAETWYVNKGTLDRVVRLVFLPFYPILIRVFSLFTGEYFFSGIIISLLSSMGAGCALYRLALMDMPRADALRTVRFFLILPGSFFYGCELCESLFVLEALLCVLCARRRRFLPACLFGALAAFTRSPGLTLTAPVLFEMISASARRKKGARLRYAAARVPLALLIPAGFGVYLYVNYRVSGDWLRFMVYQREHWFQSPAPFFDTVRYQLDCLLSYLRDGSIGNAVGLWGSNLFVQFASLILMLLSVKRLHPSYTAFFIVYFVFVTGVSWLLSAPRYLLVCFPLAFALAQLSRKRLWNTVLTVACALLGLAFYLAYLSYDIAVY